MPEVSVPDVRTRAVGFAAGATAALVTLLPWLLSGGILPLQNLWATQTMPDDMPFALLPVSQYNAIAIFSLLVIGGVLAGVAACLLRSSRSVPTWTVMTGLGMLQALAIVQAFVVVAIGLGLGGAGDLRAALYFFGMLAGAVAGVATGLFGFWLVTRESTAAASLGIALAAVPFSVWLAHSIMLFTSPNGMPLLAANIVHWLPTLIVGASLAWCGARPVGRLVIWAIALLALWLLPALFGAIQFALGMRVLRGDLGEMADAAAQIFPAMLGEAWLPVIVAAGVGLVGAVALEVMRRDGNQPDA